MTHPIRLSFAVILMTLTPIAAGAQAGADSGSDGRVAMTGTLAGDSGLWYVSSAEVLPAGVMSAGFSRAGEARNEGAADASYVAVSLARGVGGHAEIFGAWHLRTWIDGDRGRGDALAGAKVALLSQRQQAPFALAVRGIVKLPAGNEETGISTGSTDLLVELVASRRLGRVEITGSSGIVRRGDPDGAALPDGVRSGVGIGVLATRSLRLFADLHGETYLDAPANVRLTSAFDTPRTLAGGASYTLPNGLSATAAISRAVRPDDDRAGTGVAVRLGYRPVTRRRPLTAPAPLPLPPRTAPPSPPVAASPGSAPAGSGFNGGPIAFDEIYFDYDQSTLRPASLLVLDRAVSVLNADRTIRVRLEGHTCEVGTSEYNLALGERRARTVRDYLVNRGIDAARLESVSYGEERPKYSMLTEETRALNRRAELVVR